MIIIQHGSEAMFQENQLGTLADSAVDCLVKCVELHQSEQNTAMLFTDSGEN